MQHADEFRRCLIEADVAGIMRVWAHVAPHLCNLSPGEALTALHIARIEAKSMPANLKRYSLAWLAERGFRKIDGRWVEGVPKRAIAEAVGIASMSKDREFSKKIVRAMTDALLNGLAKGIVEPPMQRELMMKARSKIRARAGRI